MGRFIKIPTKGVGAKRLSQVVLNRMKADNARYSNRRKKRR